MDAAKRAEKIINTIESELKILDFEDEYIVSISFQTELKILKHYHNKKFFGWNLYAQINENLILIDTRDTEKQAKKLRKKLSKALKNGILEFQLSL